MKCIIKIKDNRIWFEGNFPLSKIRDLTSYEVQGSFFSSAYKNGYWDGRKHLFDKRSNSCPQGLLDLIVKDLKDYDPLLEIEIIDQKSDLNIEIPKTLDLEGKLKGKFGTGVYDYQLEAALQALRAKRGILKMSTNSGKTSVAAAIIKYLNKRTLFIVPGIDLLYQTSEALKNLIGIDSIGLIGDGHCSLEHITVAVLDSLHNKLIKKEIEDQWEVVFIDECHQAGSDTCYEALDLISAPFRIGLSGTPLDRSDGASLRLIAQTGGIIYEVSNKLLVERGISVQPILKLMYVDSPKVPKTKMVDGVRKKLTYLEAYAQGITDNLELNTNVCKELLPYLRAGKQVVVIINYTRHGELLEELLTEMIDCKSVFIHGKLEGVKRKEILKDFVDGEIRCLIGTSILNQGIDMDCIDVMCFPGGGKATIAALQRIGRGLRSGRGRENLIVIDVMNLCHPFFKKHSKARLDIYKKEECFIMKTIDEPD